MQKLKTQKGITLIALIITIIVMLILVGVSVTVALNGGLFSTAQTATNKTQLELEREQLLSIVLGAIGDDGEVVISELDEAIAADGTFEGIDGTYTSKKSGNKYTVGTNASITLVGKTEGEDPEGTIPSTYKTSIEGLAEGVTLIAYENIETETSADIKAAVDAGKISAVLKEGEEVAVLPTGFEVSTEDGEDSITGGLVISDTNSNEFVWIPVTNAASYTEDSFGPLTGTHSITTYVYDSQEELNYYYGMKEDGSTPYYNYADFTYATDKTNVEKSIQTYGGFYVGRYETTIDGTTIGVQAGKTILTAATILKTGTNTTSNDEYHYRWWGLYKAQKDMYANNTSVGSCMISSKQWDEIMTFTGYGSTKRAINTYSNYDSTSYKTTAPDLSGSAYSTDNTQYDVSKNIYDLAGNVDEFTLKAYDTITRTFRGGDCSGSYYKASRSIFGSTNVSSTYTRF